MQNPRKRAKKIIKKHGDFIRSVIRFHIRNEEEAEDVFKDLYKFLVAKPIPEEVQNVKGFLYKLISDIAKETYRRIGRYQERLRRYAENNFQYIDEN
jgi:DNA-directed RNA polymerase specialized sigma24 family protein